MRPSLPGKSRRTRSPFDASGFRPYHGLPEIPRIKELLSILENILSGLDA